MPQLHRGAHWFLRSQSIARACNGTYYQRQLYRSIVETSERLKVKLITFGDALPRTPGFDATHVTSFGEFRGFVTALASMRSVTKT